MKTMTMNQELLCSECPLTREQSLYVDQEMAGLIPDSWFNWWVSFAPNFSVAISVSPHVCFILVLILISMFLR